MPQGNLKSKGPSKSQIKKKSAAERKPGTQTKKGKMVHGPKKASLADKLTKKLQATIVNKMENGLMDKFSQGGGRLSLVHKTFVPEAPKKVSGSHR